MNFAAQFFYYTYQSDGTPWTAGVSESEEYDPFWQRWDTAPPDPTEQHPPQCVLDTPAPLSPGVVDSVTHPQESLQCLVPNPPLPAFHSLVGLLLRLALSFILLFFCSEEQRIGGERKNSALLDGWGLKDGSVANGCLAHRATPIHPERLKDFGEEEYLDGDVRTWEAKVVVQPEPQLTSTPKHAIKRGGEMRAPPEPEAPPEAPPETPHETPPEAPPEHLRFEDISAAAFKIQSGLQKSPCTYSRLSKHYGMEIFLKKEHLHYTGSVKERGVLYILTSLKQEQQRKGVIVATDNNFSMAVSHHAADLRIPVFVIIPVGGSPARLRMYRDYGAMVISYGSTPHHSQNHARHLAKENDYLYLEEDDSAVYMAGLGTVGMEIYEQIPRLDAVILPTGGNCRLLAGAAAALKHIDPHISVIGVEPEDYPILLRSLKNDYPVKELYNSPNTKLYGDLVDPPLGGHAFQLAKKLVDKVISVREEDTLVAMLRFQEYERSTVDAEGAIGLAAISAGKLPELKGKRVSVVVSSANMELGLVRQCVERALVLDDQVVRFMVELGDLPGDMAKLLEILAREDIRLHSVSHRRHSDRFHLFKAQVECVVETWDKAQSSQLRNTLSEHYPSLCWLDR
ncbi:hypothetical protein SKAU_G00163950 [Synaphobranchus kaupii]|uniref:L-serine deaminase n=1 Tax=Synaphobranchus kaupii TaxID=118154 RepID=A0A9Q1FJM9_SYNKA|nr:hypothetical protein SKAU_G00163950 [Synaphobranchus kaupii]